MKSLLAAALLVVTVVAVPATPAFAGASGIYRNCDALHKKYPHGVGTKVARDKTSGKPVTTFTRDNAAFNKAMDNNKGLDRDKDSIACEKA